MRLSRGFGTQKVPLSVQGLCPARFPDKSISPGGRKRMRDVPSFFLKVKLDLDLSFWLCRFTQFVCHGHRFSFVGPGK